MSDLFLRGPDSTAKVRSGDVGWTSIDAATHRYRGQAEAFEIAVASRHRLSVVSNGQLALASRPQWVRNWPPLVSRGLSCFIPAGESDCLQWRAPHGNFEITNVYISHDVFRAVTEEYRRIGSRSASDRLAYVNSRDPLIAEVANAIVEAAAQGVPELYAETAIQFLALHLLRLMDGRQVDDDRRSAGRLLDRRLAAVMAYMRANYMKPLTVDELAREACVGYHHFSHMFKRRTGVPPHQALMQIRLDEAARMLKATDQTVLQIALACGFYGSAHLAEAFRRRFGQSPSQYRASR